MKNKKIVGIVLVTLIAVIVILGVIFNQTCKSIEGYRGTKAYEDLSYIEKNVVKIKGYTIYTREQLRDNEASKIVTILKKMGDLGKLYDVNNKNILNEEINECDKILDELHKENSSGKISDDSLKVIINNSISAVENHRKSLECFKNGDLKTYSEFAKKSDENATQITNEMERLGFSK